MTDTPKRVHLTFDERFLAELSAATEERITWMENMLRAAKRGKGMLGRKRITSASAVGGIAGTLLHAVAEMPSVSEVLVHETTVPARNEPVVTNDPELHELAGVWHNPPNLSRFFNGNGTEEFPSTDLVDAS